MIVPTTLRLANRSAAALWLALAEARGHPVVRRPGFLAVEGDERDGLRIVMVSPEPAAEDLTELAELIARRADGRVLLEDPFGVIEPALKPLRMPVMIRTSGSVASTGGDVVRVERADQLAIAERMVVEAFPLASFQPYRRGEAFPARLLDLAGVGFYLISQQGDWAGACMTVADDTVAGVYFVTTLPEFRSRGIARTLMHAVLAELAPLPVTLTASDVAKRLYDSLDFETIAHSTWWSAP